MLRTLLYRPEALLVVTFGTLILVGTALLSTPTAQAESVGVLDAFFTATSAVCVTGLITVDTAAYTRFGQGVILVLIQLGGLGIMTFGAVAAQLFRIRLSFASHAAWQRALFETQTRGDIRTALRRIVLITLVAEAIGTALLYVGLRDGDAPAGGWFEAVFLSISAFCNAGFSVYSDNVERFGGTMLVMVPLSLLILTGGLGYTVLIEMLQRLGAAIRRRPPRTVVWSLQSRIVLSASAVLLIGGAAAFLAFGFDESEGRPIARIGHAVFQSITARTAGFNTVDIGALAVPSLLIAILLMFVGGSPGSCAGGIKTTTMVVWMARVVARLTGREDVQIGERRIPHDIVRRAALLIAIGALWNFVGIMVLTLSEGVGPDRPFEHLCFEQVSAFATVGLSTGLTPELSIAGKLWIIASMFVGRLGPMTIALAVLPAARKGAMYPTERVMIG